MKYKRTGKSGFCGHILVQIVLDLERENPNLRPRCSAFAADCDRIPHAGLAARRLRRP